MNPGGGTAGGDAVLTCLLRGLPLPDLAPGPVDAIVQSLSREGLAAFVHDQLLEVRETRPSWACQLAQRLRPLRLAAAGREMLLTETLAAVLDLLVSAGIPVMPLKGAELAYRLYAAPAQRFMSDLDLWVPADAVIEALDLLARDHWRETNADPAIRAYHLERGYHIPLEHPQRHIELELHHRLYPDLPTPAQESIWERAVEGQLLDRPVRFPDPADRVLILCSHLGTAGLEEAGRWLLDLTRLRASADPALHPQSGDLVARAREYEQTLFLIVAAVALRQRWGVTALAPVAAELAGDLRPAERRLLHQLVRHGPWLNKHKLLAARRLAGRSLSIPHAWFTSLWCHPGTVCLEMGVRSSNPAFPLYRLGHAARRLWGAARGLAR